MPGLTEVVLLVFVQISDSITIFNTHIFRNEL